MGENRYNCSHCDDFVSRGTRSSHLKQITERKESASEAESQIYQILSTKLQRRRRPDSEQDKFLSDVKSEIFVNLHAYGWRHGAKFSHSISIHIHD